MNSAIRSCVAGLSLAFAVPSFACSICRCGDPTFNALGKEGVAQSGLRLAFVISCVLPGPQFIAYLLLWALIPAD